MGTMEAGVNAILTVYEKLVSDFTWRRLGLSIVLIAVPIIYLWTYETYTGHFRVTNMQFTIEHVSKLADPELKQNIAGDVELMKAHHQMKNDLNRLLEGWQFNLGMPGSTLPEPILKAIITALAACRRENAMADDKALRLVRSRPCAPAKPHDRIRERPGV